MMKRTVFYAIVLVFAAPHAFAGVVPVPKPFHAGEEQTDARMIYVGESESDGLLAIDNHAEFMLARDDNNVMFNKPGTYFMHVRGHGINPNGDSCHGGLDMQQSPGLIAIGSFPSRSGEYKWMGGKKFEVPHAGLHKINLWMREDGAMIDKIVITTSGQLPKDKGPTESPRGGGDIVKTQ